jgi:predicted Fe-S protein YdhL (DUF1289 family)
MRRAAIVLAATLLVIAACARTTADRAQWLQMSPGEKSLYVGSLLGHEQAKQAKGGNDLHFDRPAADYVRLIDDAYAHGDPRDVDAVFESLGVRRPPG